MDHRPGLFNQATGVPAICPDHIAAPKAFIRSRLAAWRTPPGDPGRSLDLQRGRRHRQKACDEDRNRILNGASSVGSRRLKVFAVNPRRFRRAGQDCGGFEFGIGIVAFGDPFCGAVASSILAVRNRDAASVAETMRKPAAAV
jgi:hypothetical protein